MTRYSGKRRPNSMRHADHDYTATGAYFITICIHDRRPLFGHITDGVMVLNALGLVAQHCLPAVAGNHPHINLDCFVIMPNHVHVLLLILALADDQPPAVQRQFASPIAGSISTLVSAYKAEVSRRARRTGLTADGKLWQRNFWDHIVRNEHEMNNIRDYIQTNPQRWDADRLHPTRPTSL